MAGLLITVAGLHPPHAQSQIINSRACRTKDVSCEHRLLLRGEHRHTISATIDCTIVLLVYIYILVRMHALGVHGDPTDAFLDGDIYIVSNYIRMYTVYI